MNFSEKINFNFLLYHNNLKTQNLSHAIELAPLRNDKDGLWIIPLIDIYNGPGNRIEDHRCFIQARYRLRHIRIWSYIYSYLNLTEYFKIIKLIKAFLNNLHGNKTCFYTLVILLVIQGHNV